MENDNDEPVMCSKCNKAFENESEYLETLKINTNLNIVECCTNDSVWNTLPLNH